MLSEQQLEIISEAIQPLFQYLEHEVIVDVAKRIKESLSYTRTAELEAISMHNLGYSPAKIRSEAMKILNADAEYRKMVAKNTLEHKKKVKDLLNSITRNAYDANSEVISDAGNMSYADDLSVWKQANKTLGDNSYLHQLTDAITEQTNSELKNLTQTTGFRAKSGLESLADVYRSELDKAAIKICTGTYTKDQVLWDVVHDLAHSGLRSIDFSNNRSMRLDTAVRMAIRTGCHQMAGKITDKNIEQTGENLVYVSEHWGARNKGEGHANHEDWQGKVYYIKQGTDYTEEAKRIGQDHITDLWYSTGYSVDGTHVNDPQGLDGYNCRHRRHVWFEGISSFPKEDPEPEPKKIDGKEYDYYAMTQKMRYMERNIRALKCEKEALEKIGEDSAETKTKIKQEIVKYKSFCSKCGISAKLNRLRYEKGTSELNKTFAWQEFKEELNNESDDDYHIVDV